MQNIWQFQKIVVPLHPLKKKHRGVEQLVARQAHNLEVARSNPASATKMAVQSDKQWAGGHYGFRTRTNSEKNKRMRGWLRQTT